MLSKAPMKMKEMEDEEKESSPKLSPEEAADLKIASSLLTTSLLSEQGEQALVTALSGPEPEKAVAVIIAQIIEMAQTESGQTDIPMTPTVWLMEDGAIDNAEEDIEMIAEANGVELPDDFVELVIDEVATVLMKRREDILAKQQGGGAPPSPAPMPGQPMGGMPNGMG
jgi:hypothetical protein